MSDVGRGQIQPETMEEEAYIVKVGKVCVRGVVKIRINYPAEFSDTDMQIYIPFHIFVCNDKIPDAIIFLGLEVYPSEEA